LPSLARHEKQKQYKSVKGLYTVYTVQLTAAWASGLWARSFWSRLGFSVLDCTVQCRQARKWHISHKCIGWQEVWRSG